MQQMDLLTVVEEPTWKEMLIDLVASQKMNPWEVDLIKVADAYLGRVRELQALDLRVPANVILACALLLKFKAESLRFEEEPQEEYYETPELLQEEVPELVYRANQPRTRRLTLEELVNAVEDVMREGPRQPLKIAVPKIIELDLPKIDMSELMQKVYSQATRLKDGQQLVLFSALVGELKKMHENGGAHATSGLETESSAAANGHSTGGVESEKTGGLPASGHGDSVALKLKKISFNSKGEALAFYLVPVLHLVQQNKLLAWQEEHFSEIFLQVLPEAAKKQN